MHSSILTNLQILKFFKILPSTYLRKYAIWFLFSFLMAPESAPQSPWSMSRMPASWGFQWKILLIVPAGSISSSKKILPSFSSVKKEFQLLNKSATFIFHIKNLSLSFSSQGKFYHSSFSISKTLPLSLSPCKKSITVLLYKGNCFFPFLKIFNSLKKMSPHLLLQNLMCHVKKLLSNVAKLSIHKPMGCFLSSQTCLESEDFLLAKSHAK